MGIPLVARMRANAAFSAGLKAGRGTTDPFARGRVAMRKAGVRTVGGGFFYRKGFEYARANRFNHRSDRQGLDEAFEQYEAEKNADIDLMVAELTLAGAESMEGLAGDDDAADVLGDAADDETQLDIDDDDSEEVEGELVEESEEADVVDEESTELAVVDDPGDFDPGDQDFDDADCE